MNEYIEITREQFKDEINWEKWDELVALTRKQIAEALNDYKYSNVSKVSSPKTIYGYNSNGELVKEWKSKINCCDELDGNPSTILNYIRKSWVFCSYILSYDKLTQDIAFAMYRNAIEKGHIYKFGFKQTKHKKPIYSYNENGKMIGVFESLNQYCKCQLSTNLTLLRERLNNNNGEILSKGNLLSFNFYDELTAREIYKEQNEKRSISIKRR